MPAELRIKNVHQRVHLGLWTLLHEHRRWNQRLLHLLVVLEGRENALHRVLRSRLLLLVVDERHTLLVLKKAVVLIFQLIDSVCV